MGSFPLDLSRQAGATGLAPQTHFNNNNPCSFAGSDCCSFPKSYKCKQGVSVRTFCISPAMYVGLTAAVRVCVFVLVCVIAVGPLMTWSRTGTCVSAHQSSTRTHRESRKSVHVARQHQSVGSVACMWRQPSMTLGQHVADQSWWYAYL